MCGVSEYLRLCVGVCAWVCVCKPCTCVLWVCCVHGLYTHPRTQPHTQHLLTRAWSPHTHQHPTPTYQHTHTHNIHPPSTQTTCAISLHTHISTQYTCAWSAHTTHITHSIIILDSPLVLGVPTVDVVTCREKKKS